MTIGSNIAAPILPVVLGAGRASRFGADKLAQPLAGRPLGAWALAAVEGCGIAPLWIAGRDTAPPFVDCAIAHNPDASVGIGTSVALAARMAQERGAAALLVVLADMPLVTTALLMQLIAAGAPAACRYPKGQAGVPALIPASAFAELEALRGDHGAGQVLAGLPGLTHIDCPADVLLDVDTPAALAEAERLITTRRSD